ncbi:MAG: amino acid ABC transporter permease [Rhodobacterales bacterium]
MSSVLSWLRGIRASNLIFLAVVPLLIYLVASSRNYGPALSAVLGIEDNPGPLLLVFLLAASALMSGFVATIMILRTLRPDQTAATIIHHRNWTLGLFAVQCAFFAILAKLPATDAYVVSVAVNSVDPRDVDWLIISNQSFALEPAFQATLLIKARIWLWFLALAGFACVMFVLAGNKVHQTRPARLLWIVLFLLNLMGSFYILMMAHPGFAVGIMVTLRAAVFAYLGASILGLLWALLKGLKPSRRATILFGAVGVVLLGVGMFNITRPHQQVALVGTLEGKIGIVSGTPQGLSDTVRYGEFQAVKPDSPYKVRSLATPQQALDLLAKGSISAALLPTETIGDLPVLWRDSFLPGTQKAVGTTALVLGTFLLLLAGVGAFVTSHPLTVFSDFFVDTIRGIPMLVIILYVGLPLAGAVKSASAGYIDMPMMARGVIAIAFGYSAYMAEIFRAGIEAIPKGQIEAARTLGLREIQVARLVIVPQAIAIVLPALGNEFIAMLKDTSLVSILSVRDITQRMREFQAQSFLAFEPFNSAALVYLFLTLIAASGIKALDGIVNKSRSH